LSYFSISPEGGYYWLYEAFEEVEILTERNTTMGIEELLLDRATKQGIETGVEKGEHRKALDIAREMKKESFPVEQIAKFTKLSVEEIEKL
jgi:predicted transposase/invertase (TIGR01784 family)